MSVKMADESERGGMVIDDVGGGGLNLAIVAGKRKRELTWEEKALTVLDIVGSQQHPACQPAERDCSLIDSEKDYSCECIYNPQLIDRSFIIHVHLFCLVHSFASVSISLLIGFFFLFVGWETSKPKLCLFCSYGRLPGRRTR